MSNTAVGQVYKRVIDAVVESSRTDFEEYGVKNEVLESLRTKWQERLSQASRALFPWDPQPSQPLNSPTQPTPSSTTEPVSEPTPSTITGATPSSNAQQQNGHNDAPVKQEQPFDANSFLNLPQQNYTSGLGSQYASQRAAQLLQQQFGSQASGSIGALQAAGMRQQSSSAQGQPSQGDSSSLQQSGGSKPPLKQESTPQVKQENNDENSLAQAQNDGASDSMEQWNAVIVRRNAKGDHEPMGRLAVDGMLRRQVEQMAQRLEGGGLMVPLDERYPKHRAKRTTQIPQSRPTIGDDVVATNTSEKSGSIMQGGRYDGIDDSDLDEDAINSDLDDPDETADNSIEGVYEGDVILCLYDKVQRVKNKWKCVLKDGVVTVDGKDYVFHKASGEFEW